MSRCTYGVEGCNGLLHLHLAFERDVDWRSRAILAEAKVADLAAHIRRLEEELGHAPDGSGAV